MTKFSEAWAGNLKIIGQQVEHSLQEYHDSIINDHVSVRVLRFAENLVKEAVENRFGEPGAHNFTGNLITSICSCVYKNKQPLWAFFASDYIRKPVRMKMTTGRSYYFKQDYDGEESDYEPEIETDEGWGPEDAKEFFREVKPTSDAVFAIIVAYPVEYATFVESSRHTAGFANTYFYAMKNGWKMLQLLVDSKRINR